MHDDYHIITWRKYQTLEKLSSQPLIPQEPLLYTLPESLLPIARDEFVIGDYGGTVTVGGVKMTMEDSGGYLPTSRSRHLLFVMLRASGLLAVANYGSASEYWVDDNDVIHARIESDDNPLRSDLISRTGRHLSQLRTMAASK